MLNEIKEGRIDKSRFKPVSHTDADPGYAKAIQETLMKRLDNQHIANRDMELLLNDDKIIAPKVWYCLEFLVEWTESNGEENRNQYLDIKSIDIDILNNHEYWQLLKNYGVIQFHPKNINKLRFNDM